MTIIHIETQKRVKKSKQEYQKDLDACKYEMREMLVSEYKSVPRKEPIYIVEMSAKEIQLVSFYLELENRKPIMNVEIDTKSRKRKAMSEMDKLQKWLDENNIKYERYIEEGRLNRNQILIRTNKIELSFVCHFGSYGYERGLIEMYDFVNEPEGFLTAEQCISKLKEIKL